MRRVLGGIAAAGLCGCTLLVSTSDLSGGGATPAMPDADADALAAEAAADATVETSIDTGVDAAPRDPSIIGEWHFDDVNDSSGRGHPADLSGDAVITGGGVAGGKCVTLAGAGRIKMSALFASGFPAKGTLSFHMKYTFVADDPEDRALFDGWDGTRAHLFVRRPPSAPAQEFQAAFQPPNVSYAWATGFTLAPNQWAHVVLVWRSGDDATGEGGLYVDRKLVKRSGLDRAFAPDAQEFELGVRFIGSIDEVVLYDRALTDAEALALD